MAKEIGIIRKQHLNTARAKNFRKRTYSFEFLIAFMLQVSIFSAIPSFLGFGTGYTTLFYIAIWCIALILLAQEKQVFLSGFYPLFAVALLVLSLPTFILYSHETRLSIFQFISFTILPFLLFFKALDAERLLKYVIRLSLVHILYLNVIFNVSETGSLNMTLAYGLLISVLACLVLLKYYRAGLTSVDCVAILVNVYYMINVVLFGNRGQLVALVVVVALLYIGKTENQNSPSKGRVFRLAAVLVVTIILIMNIQGIVTYADTLLKGIGIEISGLSRSVMLANSGVGADAYRFEQYGAALEGFLRSPIVGNGFCTFEYINRGGQLIEYPHNLFIQFLNDGGFLLFLAVTGVLIAGTILVFRHASKSDYAIFILLFSSTVPHFMFSSDVFLQSDIWILLAFLWYFMHGRKTRDTLLDNPQLCLLPRSDKL